MTRAPAQAAEAPPRAVSAVELERRAFRKRQGARSVVDQPRQHARRSRCSSGCSSSTRPGWAAVQQSSSTSRSLLASLPRVFEGFLLNLRVLVIAAVVVLIFGLLLATLRTLRGPVWFPLRALAAGYTDLFRGMPLIIVLYLVGFGIPGLAADPGRMPSEFWGDDRADPHLLGLRLRGVPRRHRGRAPVAAPRRALARPQPRPDDAAGRGAAGRAQGDARAHERLRRDAEGCRPDLGARRGRRRARRPDRDRARTSTSRRTSWPGCCSCCWRCR